ncbi:MAG: hypothetical protein ACYTF6_14365, partial [Planctomycetota bacterium]
MDEKILSKALADALGPYLQQKSGHVPYGLKATGVPSETSYLYETGGLFGRCDGPKVIVNAMVGPIGIEKYMDWVGVDTEKEFVDALKAVNTQGSEQSTACGDCMKIYLTACAQFYCFGRFCRQTQELQFDRLGVRAHEAIPVKALFGNITDDEGNILLRQGELITDAFLLQTRAVGYALSVKKADMMWTGNPANNNATTYMEFMGFDLIINSGKFDAYTQLDCDSIDSFLMDFANNNPAATGTYAITNWYRRAVLQLITRAEGAGMSWDTAKMFIAMSPNQWDCVARVYACTGIELCDPPGSGQEIVVSADAAGERYQEYLERMALPIYGRWYPVALDNMISETPGQANGTCSDHYFITTEINGEAITFGQYQDFNKTYGKTRQELVSMFGSDDIAVTDNGRYAM